jgi:cytochrome P450
MPGYSIHANTDIWGATAGQFGPYRFVNPDTRRGVSDFLAWGAPPHMCPARKFAATEILIFVALLAVRAGLIKGRLVVGGGRRSRSWSLMLLRCCIRERSIGLR